MPASNSMPLENAMWEKKRREHTRAWTLHRRLHNTLTRTHSHRATDGTNTMIIDERKKPILWSNFATYNTDERWWKKTNNGKDDRRRFFSILPVPHNKHIQTNSVTEVAASMTNKSLRNPKTAADVHRKEEKESDVYYGPFMELACDIKKSSILFFSRNFSGKNVQEIAKSD